MAVTANVFERVLRVTCPDGSFGTAFTPDIEDAQFLVTADHVLPPDPAEVQLANRFRESTQTVRRLPGMRSGADMAVCRLDEPIHEN